MKLQGMFADAATPFDHTGAIYPVKVQHNVEKWCRTALAGFVFGSIAGEGALLDPGERIDLWRLALPHVLGGRISIADVTAEGLLPARKLAKAAAEVGALAVMSLPPHFYRIGRNGCDAPLLFFRALADESPVPVVIHHAPSWTGGLDIPADTIALLAEHPNMAGVLETGTPSSRVRDIRRVAGKDFAVLTGSGTEVWEALQSGASGAVLPLASAVPYAAVAIWEAFRTREEEAGLDWQGRIANASRLITQSCGVAGIKHAMDCNGYYGGPPRLPLTRLGAEDRAAIEDAFEIFRGC